MQEDLFGNLGINASPEPVMMSLKPEYYELIWHGVKRHEFRRRYLTGCPTTWYVYLTAPVSRLSAIIDLDEAIVDTPQRIAEIAEQTGAGNGVSVYEYLRDLECGFAIPITRVREYPGFAAADLIRILSSFHPPQGYILLARHPALTAVCEKLSSADIAREMTVQPTNQLDVTRGQRSVIRSRKERTPNRETGCKHSAATLIWTVPGLRTCG